MAAEALAMASFDVMPRVRSVRVSPGATQLMRTPLRA